jgi:hypothetical protein
MASDGGSDSGCNTLSAPAADAVLSLSVDAAGRLHHVAYLGPGDRGGGDGCSRARLATRLGRLVGLPFTFVAGGLGILASSRVGDGGLHGTAVHVAQASVQEELSPGVQLLSDDLLVRLAQPWATELFSALDDGRIAAAWAAAAAASPPSLHRDGWLRQHVVAALLPPMRACATSPNNGSS